MGIQNFLHSLLGGGSQQPLDEKGNPISQPQQGSGLPDLPGGPLNIFSVFRGYTEARQRQQQLDQAEQQRQTENKFTGRAEDRAQQTFDTARATQATLGGLSAFSNMADSIANNSNIAEADRPQAYAVAFDRIAPALAAAGYDENRIANLREHLIANPSAANDLLAGLEEGLGGQGSRQGLQAAFDQNGQAVFIDPRTGRPAARGYAPATAVLGQTRTGIAQQNANTAGGRLEQQQLQNDPTHAFDVSSAQAEGTVAGQNAAREPEAVAAGNEVIRRIDTILDTPPDQLADVLGTPSLAGALRGGFGQYGAWPGSERNNIAADINGLTSSMRSAAYQLVLKGGGSITEAESAFAAQAFVNLDRSQSPGQFRDNLQHAREYFSGLTHRYQSQSAPTRNPNRPGNIRNDGAAPAPNAPAARQAPASAVPAADPRARRSGETTDAYLARLGL